MKRNGDLEKLRDGSFESLATTVAGLKHDVDDAENSDSNGTPVEDAKMKLLRRQQLFIDSVVAGTKLRTVVLSVTPPSSESGIRVAVVSYQGNQLETQVPNDMEIAPGDEVSLLNTTLQPISVVNDPIGIGDVATVSRMLGETTCEVSFHGVTRVVLNGLAGATLEVGDKVVLDSSSMIVTGNLGKARSQFQFTGAIEVGWGQIIGCVVAKEKLRDAIEIPYTRSDVFVHYKDEPPKGLALIGAPGCGKTMLLKASARAHRLVHGENAFVLLINGAELLEGIVGDTEKLIRQLFALPRAHFRKTGVRGLLIIDEAEALLPKRGSGRSSDVEKTNVATFLAEMNGVESDGNPILIVATNRPDLFDDAVMRDERIDEVIAVAPPTREDAPAFFELYLKDVPIEGSSVEIAAYATEEFFSPVYALAQVERRSTGKVEPFTLGHVVNGAMLRGIVRRAKRLARARDLEGTKPGEPLGKVTRDDIKRGVEDALEKNRHLDNRAAFLRFVRGFKDDIAEGDKVLRTVFGE